MTTPKPKRKRPARTGRTTTMIQRRHSTNARPFKRPTLPLTPPLPLRKKRRRLLKHRGLTRPAGGADTQHSWRDHWRPYPTAEAYPRLSRDEQRKLAADIDKNGLKIPIQTGSVVGQGDFLLDGRERLDAIESLGWQIVNEKGEWMGVLARSGQGDKVVHRAGLTRDMATALVKSLNDHRRHMTASQRAMVAAELANMRQGKRTDLQPSANLREVSQPQAAKMLNVSERSVQAAAKVMREAPEKVKAVKAGKLTISKAAREAKPRRLKPPVDKTSLEFVNKRLGQFLKRWTRGEQRVVREVLLGILLSRYEDNKLILPASVTYADGKTEKVANII